MAYTHEDLVNDVEDFTVSDVMFLGILNCSPAKITRIQKLSLFAARILDLGPELSHYAYDFGGFSNEIHDSELTLEEYGAISKDNDEFSLESYGRDLLAVASEDPRFAPFVGKLPGIVAFLESLSDWDLKQLSYILYPDTAEKSTIKHKMNLDARYVGDFKITRDLSREQMQKLLLQREGSLMVLDQLVNRKSVIVSDGRGSEILVTMIDGHYIVAERITRM